MAAIDKHYFNLGYMDSLSRRDSALHRLDPRAKLLTTLLFVAVVVSFGKYEISALIPFFIYPIVLISAGNLPAGYIARRILIVAPFAVMIGIFNPLIDRAALIQIEGIAISGGWVSFISILIRFVLTVGAALILIALTGFNAVCMALERLYVPKVFVVQLLFLHRYTFVLVKEAIRMVRARALRVFNGNGMGMKPFGSMAGHLLLRTLDRAQRIYTAMCCRGFDGSIRILMPLSIGSREVVFTLGWTGLFVLMRVYNIPRIIGAFVTEFLK